MVNQTSLAVWCQEKAWFLPSAGKRFTWDGHEYLKEPYDCQAQFQSYMKAAQLGFSEKAVLGAIHDCQYRLKSGVLYLIPTKTDVTDFSKGRFKPLLDENPELKAMVQETDAANIKRIGKAMLYLRGMRTTVGLKSVPADKVVFDEIDEAVPSMVDLAMKRMSHSEFQEVEALSTPTIPEYGIHAMFLESDQRHWFIRCDACGEFTCLELEFPNCIKRNHRGEYYRACKKCGAEISPANGVWVPSNGKGNGEGGKVGYRVSQLVSQYVPLATIMDEFRNTKFPADFWNSRLAQPYIEATHRLEVAYVLNLCSNFGMEGRDKGPCAMGIDTSAERLHVVAARVESGVPRVIWIGEHPWEDLDDLMERYNAYAVLDGVPEPDKARDFVKRHSGRAWACSYTNAVNKPERWDDAENRVTVYQTLAMDASHKILQEKKAILPRAMDEVQEFAKHCHNVARRKVEDEETGNVHFTWLKLADDHYRRAFNFLVLAMCRVPVTEHKDDSDKALEEYYDQMMSGELPGAFGGGY